ncbi:MAG: carbon storage regulator [Planctomycetaceae bacterium]
MLVLTRKLGEKILIDSEIEVTVLEIRGGKVRLGFKAPQDVSLRRAELDLRGEPEPAAPAVRPDAPQLAPGFECCAA